MRKIFAILTALLLVSCSMNHDEVVVAMKATQSTKISKEQALKNLYSELKLIDGATRADGTLREVKSIKPLVGAVTRSGNTLDNDLLYIVEFGEGQGSAVVAADTRLKPVIAVLDSDVLTAEDFASDDTEDISVYVASLITNYADGAASVNSSGLLPAPGNTVVDTIYTVNVPPLLNTKWHQSSPYNDLCVNYNGENVPAGCAAVAIAQFAYYHQSPNVINGYTVNWSLLSGCEYEPPQVGGTFPGGTIGGGTIGGGTIGGGQIIFNPNALAHAEGARFVYNIGVGLGIDYANSKSGATPNRMREYLEEIGYDCSLEVYICNTVKEIVREEKPVIMSGYSANNEHGHAWVVDGWKDCIIRTTTASPMPEGPVGSVEPEYTITEEYFDRIHCNFGWNGHCDGYYIGDIFNCRYQNNYIEPGIGDIPDSFTGDDPSAYNYNGLLGMFCY